MGVQTLLPCNSAASAFTATRSVRIWSGRSDGSLTACILSTSDSRHVWPLVIWPPAVQRCSSTVAERIATVFRMWDTDEDGAITKDELVQVLSSLGVAGADALASAACADSNKDGKIDYEEF